MKNKYKTLILLIGVTCTTQLLAKITDNPVTVFAEADTTNPSLADNKSIRVGEKLGMQQDITQHVYYTLSTTVPQNNATTFEGDFGLKTRYQRLLPFTELEGVWMHKKNNQYTSLLDYDFGTAYHVTEQVYPLAAFDSIGLRGGDAVKYGAMIQCTRNTELTVAALKYLRHTGSALQDK